ncbi:MAG: glycosyltransferase family 2 protein [Alicyclobacillaceae bacterium]|nr:glycosyltransferase family 2 protein [Alicyclobacillaceae bacterium]
MGGNGADCREDTVQMSIIIPTMNERDNVRRVTERIVGALGVPHEVVMAGGMTEANRAEVSYDVWFIDDSCDDTPDFLSALAARYPFVRVVHRSGTAGGLASAVAEGFVRSRGEWLVVMDADLQHPPELLPAVLERLRDGADIVVPSRFIAGGSDGGLNWWRRLVSWFARTLARLAIRRLRPVMDCTSGFFALRRTVLDGVWLRPVGWKILIEVLVRGRYRRVDEIPYRFVAREAGESKMNVREQWNYVVHLVRLVRDSQEDRRFYLLAAAGVLGVGVNLTVMATLLHTFHLPVVAASVVASLAAMAHNLLWHDRITWGERRYPSGWRKAVHVPVFLLVTAAGVLLTVLTVKVTLCLHGRALVGQAVGVCMATWWSCRAHDRWTWREWPAVIAGAGDDAPRP